MIPFLDLQPQDQSIRDEVNQAIVGVFRQLPVCTQTAVEAFESDFAEYCQGHSSIGLNSGTSALHLALIAAGLNPSTK